jgi:hypothetical protein
VSSVSFPVPTAMPTLAPTNAKNSGASATLIGAIMGGVCAAILLTLMCYYGLQKSSTPVGFAAAGPGRQSYSVGNMSGPPVRQVHLHVISDAYLGGAGTLPPPPPGLRSPYSPMRLPPPRLDI